MQQKPEIIRENSDENNDFEARQNLLRFFSLLLKVNIKIKINFSISQKKSKYEFLWKLARFLLLVIQVISFFIK